MFLKPSQNIALVKGLRGCAIYDFNKRRLYRLNLDAYAALFRLEQNSVSQGNAMQSDSAPFYQQCLDYGILEVTASTGQTFADPQKLFEKICCDYAWLEITNRCNQKCLHCFLGGKLNAGEMPFAKVIETLDQLIDNGMAQICLSGGEPFLHRHIYEILEYLLRKNIRISILSNGIVMTSKLAGVLKNSKITLKIPLLGWGTHHDRMVGKVGLFDKCVSNLFRLKEAGVRFEIGTTVTQINVPDLEKIELLAKELAVPYSKSPVYKIGFAKEHWEILCSNYDQILEAAKNHLCKNKDDPSSCERKYVEWAKNGVNCNDCAADKIAIDFLGNIYPCLLLRNRTFCMGNVFQDDLKKILSQKNNQQDEVSRLLSFADMPLCGKCEVRYLCKGGGCRAISQLFFHDIKKTSPYWDACYYSQQGEPV